MTMTQGLGDLKDIHIGQATICYGRRCKPEVGEFAGYQFPDGWRSPTGEITNNREVATSWAKALNNNFFR